MNLANKKKTNVEEFLILLLELIICKIKHLRLLTGKQSK